MSNENHMRYDVALILLESNDCFSNNYSLNIEWSYKRWEKENKNLTLFGYPMNAKINDFWRLMDQTERSGRQEEFIHYSEMGSAGDSGGPLISEEF